MLHGGFASAAPSQNLTGLIATIAAGARCVPGAVLPIAMWVVFAYFVLGTPGRCSLSQPERYAMVTVSIVLGVLRSPWDTTS